MYIAEGTLSTFEFVDWLGSNQGREQFFEFPFVLERPFDVPGIQPIYLGV